MYNILLLSLLIWIGIYFFQVHKIILASADVYY